MYTIVYYSATGNTKYLVNKLSNVLEVDSAQIHAVEQITSITSNEELILMFSIHGFNAPRQIKKFVKQLQPGVFKKVHLISVGSHISWANAAATLPLKKKLIAKGYEVVVDEMMAMPLTLVIAVPKEYYKQTIEEANRDIETITEHIKTSKPSNRRISLKSKMITFFGRLENPASRLFGLELHANKKCTSCGICWNSCPEKNIKENKKGKPKFGLHCAMCMRCIYRCPERAISPYISKFLTIKEGYNPPKG